MKIFNLTSLFLNLNDKKNPQMTLTGMFIENNDKNNLLIFTDTYRILEPKQLTFATLKILGFY